MTSCEKVEDSDKTEKDPPPLSQPTKSNEIIETLNMYFMEPSTCRVYRRKAC